MKQKTQLVLSLLLILLIAACGKEEPTPDPIIVAADPSSLIFNDIETGTFTVKLQSGESVGWQLSSIPAWLSATPTTGTLSTGNNQSITLTPEVDNFPPGKLSGVVEVLTTDNQRLNVNVTVCVEGRPKATLPPFNEIRMDINNGWQEYFNIKNTGSGVLVFSIETDDDRIGSFISGNDVLEEGEESEIYLQANVDQFPLGEHKANLTITTNSVEEKIVIPITVVSPPRPAMRAEYPNLDFGLNVDSRTVNIINEGNVPINWNLVYDDLGPFSFSIEEERIDLGDTSRVVITLDRSGLENGFYDAQFRIGSDVQLEDYLFINYQVYEEDKYLLDGTVVDALYSREAGMMLVAQEFPNSFVAYNPETESVQELDLDFTPVHIAVSGNGNYAAIGGVGQVVLLDLNSFSVQKEVTASGYNQAVAVDDDASLFLVGNGQAKRVLDNGLEHVIQYGNKPTSQAKLHPSGEYFYITSSSTSTAIKLKVGVDSLEFINEYVFTDRRPLGDFWFDESGDHLFTQSGSIYGIDAESEEKDIVFEKQLSEFESFNSIAFSERFNMMAGVTGSVDESDGDRFYIQDSYRYSITDCRQENFIMRPYFIGDGGNGDVLREGNHWYLGIYEDGNKYVSVGTSDYDVNSNWAISTIDIDQ